MFDSIVLGFLGDLNIVLKIFLSLAIIAFIRQRVEHKKLSFFLIVVGIFFMVFMFGDFFTFGYVIYVLLAAGITGVMVDFFFVSAGGSPEDAMKKKGNTPGTPGGTEHAARNNAMRRMKR